MRNKLTDLNNYLFEQLERLNDDDLTPEELEKEIRRSNAVTKIGQVVINNANILLEAKKHLDAFSGDTSVLPDILKLDNK
ncbi:MAG: hypothetical protein CVU86_07105 [Firmicutes bacterium HGW-Firmicutes-11]|nr:MAG: hypothetical protein CVU94_00700 [Firmicutes bacterium HGW-Firmicutes-19]PKM84493.1 MAG: hypothetical protein CVU86_07105 [Firmicutes bacterium HGW-Firmicutes-11]